MSPYPVAAIRSKNFGTPVVPWYLTGGIPLANCLAAFQPKGAADAAAALVNLANPGTYNASNGTAYPAFDTAIGWTFTAASSQYLNITTGFNPKPFTLVARITIGDTAAIRTIIGGSQNSSFLFQIKADEKAYLLFRGVAGILTSTSAVPATDAVVAVTYSAAGVAVAYLNGAADGTATSDRTPTANIVAIGCNASGEYMNGVIAAVAAYDIAMTGTQVAALHTAMAAL